MIKLSLRYKHKENTSMVAGDGKQNLPVMFICKNTIIFVNTSLFTAI